MTQREDQPQREQENYDQLREQKPTEKHEKQLRESSRESFDERIKVNIDRVTELQKKLEKEKMERTSRSHSRYNELIDKYDDDL